MITINGVRIADGTNIKNVIMNGNQIVIDGKEFDFNDYTSKGQKIEVNVTNCQIQVLDCENAKIWGNVHEVNGDNISIEGDVYGDIKGDVVNVRGTIQGKVKADIVNQR